MNLKRKTYVSHQDHYQEPNNHHRGQIQATLDVFMKPVNLLINDGDKDGGHKNDFLDDSTLTLTHPVIRCGSIISSQKVNDVSKVRKALKRHCENSVSMRADTLKIADTMNVDNEIRKRSMDVVPRIAQSPPDDCEASLPEFETANSFRDIFNSNDAIYSRSKETKSRIDENLASIKTSKFSWRGIKASNLKKVSSKQSAALLKRSPGNKFQRASQHQITSNAAGSDSLIPRICKITIGDYEMEPLFTSPLPLELVKKGHIFICERCIEFKGTKEILDRHMVKCAAMYPPGDEIYRQQEVSVFEVDGDMSKGYCQSLCLLAKLFIDHKTLFYDVEPFLFYVLILKDANGLHLVGYFSKQKNCTSNNLSCLLTLPCYQGLGFGRFLIDFSYLLSRREQSSGTPEKPLSSAGRIAYRCYWKSAILNFFSKYGSDNVKNVVFEDITKTTGIGFEDVIDTMLQLDMLELKNGKVTGLMINRSLIDVELEKKRLNRAKLDIDEKLLDWEPKEYITFNGSSAEDSTKSIL